DFAGRVFFEPFKVDGPAPLRGAGLGFGTTYGTAKEENYNSINYRTAGRSTFFKFDTPTGTAVNFNGSRTRFSPQGYWYWGPFGFMGEYINNSEQLSKIVTPKTGAPTVTDAT